MRRLGLVLLAGVLAGCSTTSPDSILGPTDTNVVGTFDLEAANGQVLPIAVSQTATQEFDLVSDQIVISPDLTWTETTTYVTVNLTDGSQVAQAPSISSGTYSIVNSKIQFVMTVGGAETFDGSVSGLELDLVFNGGHFVYFRPQ